MQSVKGDASFFWDAGYEAPAPLVLQILPHWLQTSFGQKKHLKSQMSQDTHTVLAPQII